MDDDWGIVWKNMMETWMSSAIKKDSWLTEIGQKSENGCGCPCLVWYKLRQLLNEAWFAAKPEKQTSMISYWNP